MISKGKLEAIEILYGFAREILIIVRVYKFRTFMPHLWRKSVQLLLIYATYMAIFSIFMFFKNSARKNMVNFATFSPHMCSSCTFFRHFLSISRTNVRKKLKMAHYFRRGVIVPKIKKKNSFKYKNFFTRCKY